MTRIDDRHLTEKKISSTEILKGDLLHAFRDTVRLPDDTIAHREYVVHPGAVMIVPMLTDDSCDTLLVLERQFRYPVGQVMIEFPAGKLNPEEEPLRCAQRELFEETGYTAIQWAYAGVLHPVISYSTEVIHIWFARGLIPGLRQLDQGEFLDVFTATVAQLLQWCRDGRITDAKTLTAALWLQNVLSGTWQLKWQDTAIASGAG